jgi:beta-glucosidase
MTTRDTVYAEVTVKNTGKMKGDEIVQLYIRDEVSSLTRPLKELKGFQRITLEAGASQLVRIPLSSKSLEFWKDGKWITEPGEFTVMLGPNSTALSTVKLNLTN